MKRLIFVSLWFCVASSGGCCLWQKPQPYPTYGGTTYAPPAPVYAAPVAAPAAPAPPPVQPVAAQVPVCPPQQPMVVQAQACQPCCVPAPACVCY